MKFIPAFFLFAVVIAACVPITPRPYHCENSEFNEVAIENFDSYKYVTPDFTFDYESLYWNHALMYDYCLESWVDGMVSRTIQRGAHIPNQDTLDILYVKFPAYLIAIESSCYENRDEVSYIINQISNKIFDFDNEIVLSEFMASEFLFQWVWANEWEENSCQASLLLSTDFILKWLSYNY